MESIDRTVQLEETELEKDLGVHIDPELKFSKHVERQVMLHMILGIRKISHNLAFALKNLGNRYFQIAFESGMSCLWIFGK